MKVKLSSLHWIAIVGSVLILAGGLGGYFYLADQLKTAQDEIVQASSERQKLLTKHIVPSTKNIETLNSNNGVLQSALNSLESRLVSPENKLSTVTQINAILFKQKLAAQRKVLLALASEKGVALPQNFYFTFSRYISQNPDDKDTLVLGKQSLAIEEIVNLLMESGISHLDSVRRTFDEIPASATNPSSALESSGEYLKGRVQKIAGGLYTVYPFEFEFSGKPVSLRNFLNKTLLSPYLLIVRSLSIVNSQPTPRKVEDMARDLGATSGTSGGSGTDPSAIRPPEQALGFEEIKVRARIDLIEWSSNTGMAPVATDNAKNPNSAK